LLPTKPVSIVLARSPNSKNQDYSKANKVISSFEEVSFEKVKNSI